jgi:hypothetical protein
MPERSKARCQPANSLALRPYRIQASSTVNSPATAATTSAFRRTTQRAVLILRVRAGYAFGGKSLFYATGGGAYAQIRNSFATSNAVNAIADNGNPKSWGYVAGGGVEQSLGRNLSIGLEYLYTRFEDDHYRVRAARKCTREQPVRPEQQPGTEYSRSQPRLDYHAARLTAPFGFAATARANVPDFSWAIRSPAVIERTHAIAAASGPGTPWGANEWPGRTKLGSSATVHLRRTPASAAVPQADRLRQAGALAVKP